MSMDNIFGTVIILTYVKTNLLDNLEPVIYYYYPYVILLDSEHKLIGFAKLNSYNTKDYDYTYIPIEPKVSIECQWTFVPILKLRAAASEFAKVSRVDNLSNLWTDDSSEGEDGPRYHMY